MNPIDLKTLAAGRFRLALDDAASIEPGGKKDTWYQIIPCKHGQIYSYSNTLLAIHSKGFGIRLKLRAIEGLTNHNWSDDGEAIFLFPPVLFDQVAEIVKPKRKRQLSQDHRQKLVKAGIEALKSCRKNNSKSAKTDQGLAIVGQSMISSSQADSKSLLG